MRFFLKILVCVLFCLLVAWPGQARQVKVAWVPDGDTLILEDRETVRLKGIDAPETAHEGGQDQYFARESTRYLLNLIANQELILKTGPDSRDAHGRTLGYVYLPDGRNLSVLMVRQGYAFYYPHEDEDQDISRRIHNAQKQAMKEGLGFWPEILSMDDPDLIYVGNAKSRRFHLMECGYGQRISEANRKEFSSLYDVFYQGYAPCRRCTPWPLMAD
ncbi:MAG: thermonuclease family protein [Desulfonatronovibrio sp.]